MWKKVIPNITTSRFLQINYILEDLFVCHKNKEIEVELIISRGLNDLNLKFLSFYIEN